MNAFLNLAFSPNILYLIPTLLLSLWFWKEWSPFFNPVVPTSLDSKLSNYHHAPVPGTNL